MSATPSEVLRCWFARVWNDGDESAIDELYAPSAVAHGLPGASVPGPEGFKPFFRAFRSAFPNLQRTTSPTRCARATSARCIAASPPRTPAG